MEPDEPTPVAEAEGAEQQPKPPRRKTKRPRKDTPSTSAEAMEENVLEADLLPEAVTLPSSDILMVEVDNVVHEQFEVTEEVKVQRSKPWFHFLCCVTIQRRLSWPQVACHVIQGDLITSARVL